MAWLAVTGVDVATREDVEPIYNFLDELWRVTFGEHADFSNALYRGDFSKPLERAQADKHRYILDAIGFTRGARVLDIGCGWGAMLEVVRRAGGTSVGLTLSRRQSEACTRAGLDARVLDWRDAAARDLGTFDAVISLGAFEHFCSVADHQQARQEAVYRRFFRLCHELLRPDGRVYLQTMLWTPNTPAYEDLSLAAPKSSPEYHFAVIEEVFPDSCFPSDLQQVERAALPYFRMLSHDNGRLDYVETIEAWRRGISRLTPRKAWIMAKLGAHALREGDLRVKLELLRHPYFSECFRRGWMDHERIILEKAVANPD